MNLALPAILVILAILPGAVFVNTYLRSPFSKRYSGLSPLAELGQFIIFAIPLDMLGLVLCQFPYELLGLRTAVGSRGLEALLTMVMGANNQEATTLVKSAFSDHWFHYGIRYIGLLVLSWAIAHFARRTVWALRIDTYVSVLKVRHEWFYRLMGRQRGRSRFATPMVDLMVEHPDGSRMYRGFLDEFELDSAGCIREIALAAAQRWPRNEEEQKADVPNERKWKPIPGNNFVIAGKTIYSINIRFIVPPDPKTRRARLWRWCRAVGHAFINEDQIPS